MAAEVAMVVEAAMVSEVEASAAMVSAVEASGADMASEVVV